MSGIEYRPCIYRNGNLKPMHVRVILIFTETDRHEAVVNARCHTFLFHLSLIWLDRLLESQYNSSIAQTNKWTHFQKSNFRRRKATVKQGNHILHLWFFEHLLQISISKKLFALVNKAASFYLTHSHPRWSWSWSETLVNSSAASGFAPSQSAPRPSAPSAAFQVGLGLPNCPHCQ